MSTKRTSTASATAGKKRKAPPRGGGGRKKAPDVPPPDIPHLSEEYAPEWMNVRRTRLLTSPEVIAPKDRRRKRTDGNDGAEAVGNACVVYWMQRDMRTVDNWALLLARHLATERNVPLRVVYTLPPPPPVRAPAPATGGDDPPLPPLATDLPMTQRHATFLLRGLRAVEKELHAINVPLYVLEPGSRGDVGRCLSDFVAGGDEVEDGEGALAVVCDFSPLRGPREWMEDQAAPLLKVVGVPLVQVDAHNVVPVWCASIKREVGARTLRPKINKLLPEFLTDFPQLDEIPPIDATSNDDDKDKDTETKNKTKPKNKNNLPPIPDPKTSWARCAEYLQVDTSIPPIPTLKPGTKPALKRFAAFLAGTPSPTSPAVTQGLRTFDTHRNDPNHSHVCTNLSPYVNHGHVSFQRLALLAKAHGKHANGTAAFLEEGIVRRELSDNFVFYSRGDYDGLGCAAQWAQDSLEVHRGDGREWVYGLEEFVEGRTHDDLWNAAQLQLVNEGNMHGFLRMYWAKKILEWTPSPAHALRTALYLNDRYALDGNDPNGFTGVGWSVMGIHDMGWKERPVFGKIRFMNYAGCKRKFKVADFVGRYRGAKENAAAAAERYGGVTADVGAVRKRKG